MTNKTIFSISFIFFLFSGCVSITKELPPQTTYNLTLKNNIHKSKFFNKTIQVYESKTLPSLNSKAIIYSKKFRQEKYALSKWSDKPTKMIQELIADYLTKQRSYKYVRTSNIKVDTDYDLVSELVSFKHIFTKIKSYANFSIRVYFTDNKTNKIYFKNFLYNKPAPTNDAKGLVEAMNIVTNEFLFDLNSFIQNTLNSNNQISK